MSALAAVFENKYQAWRAYCTRPDVMESSSDRPYIDNPFFQDIVALGSEAVPLIIGKLKQDPEAHFLIHALQQITHKRFSTEELEAAMQKYGAPLGNQGHIKLWIDWWEAQRQGR